jgi:hypothetical protein
MESYLRPGTPFRHRAIALAVILFLLGVCGWTLLRNRSAPASLALGAGDYWPRTLEDGWDEDELVERIHLILFAPGCRWCDLQLSSLENLSTEPGDGVRTVIVVVADFDKALGKLSESPLRRFLAFVPRTLLKEEIGAFLTPTHIILDSERRVLAVREGYLTRDQLKVFRARTGPPSFVVSSEAGLP